MYRYVDYIKSDLEGVLQLEALPPYSYLTVDFTPISIRQGTDGWQAYFSTNPEESFAIRHYGGGTSWRQMQFRYGNQEYLYSTIPSGDNIVAESSPTGITINGTLVTQSDYTYNYSADFYIGGVFNTSTLAPSRQTEGKYRSIVVKDEDSQVLNRYVPALNDNDILGMYDEVNDQFYQAPSGWTYGSLLHIFSPDKTIITFESTGGTDIINVMAETSWSASTEDDWITITKDGDSLTVEVPLYELSERRQGTIYFEDNDGYTFTVSIKQKAQSGAGFSTIYKGEENITDMYLGEVKIDSIYLGELQVLSSGPFEGLKVTPNKLKFGTTVSQLNMKIKSSEAWTISTDADWLSFSQMIGDSGETIVSITCTTDEYSETTINVSSSSYSKTVQASFIKYTEVALIMGESGGTVYSMSFPCTLGPDFKCEFEGSIENYITGTAVGKTEGVFRSLMAGNTFYLDILSTSNRIRISNASSKGLGLHDYMQLELTNHQVKNNGTTIASSTPVSFERMETEVLVRIVDMKAHSLKIYDGNNVIFDGVAALRDSDGQGGLWDSTRQIFMTNEDIEINETD